MNIQFTKMHGLGNDFMVIDGLRQTINLEQLDIPSLSRRDTGVGFDQCLLVEKSTTPGVDFFYRIFNANGQEVGQCGNGARCLARFLEHYQLTDKTHICIATKTTQMQLQLNPDKSVTVNMGKPKLAPADIPLLAKQEERLYALNLGKEELQIHAISVGNPHAVLLVDNIAQTAVQNIGQFISEHPLFPEQVNAGFMQIDSPSAMHLRVYERGCGETQACGSGAVAAAAVGRLFHDMAEEISVMLPGGELQVRWPERHGDIFLTGPASFVYEGTLMHV